MLPAAARMRHRDAFTQTVRAGRRAGRPLLTIHLLASEEIDGVRVGFIVSRKVGSAVVRNRVRRQLRHILRDRLDRISSVTSGADVVVRVAPAAAGATSAALAREVDRALHALFPEPAR
jgi:ribonuclease P protein component